jgi:hypothetical protein
LQLAPKTHKNNDGCFDLGIEGYGHF